MKSRPLVDAHGELAHGLTMDHQRLSQLAELGRASGRDILTPLLHQFISNAAKQLDDLALAVGRRDHARVQLIAHTLKGAAANLGALGISAIAQELEYSARENASGQDILLAQLNAAVSTSAIWIDQHHPSTPIA